MQMQFLLQIHFEIRTKMQSFLLTIANMSIFASDQHVRFENTLAKKLRACTEEILHTSGRGRLGHGQF